MKEFDELKAILDAAVEDVAKFDEKGNAAAGTRVRKAMQEVKKQAQAVRLVVTAKKNAE
mgnify:CR=1 FL=1